ncbi:MBL fold metallo-hydrolase [Maricaulis sp. CAU 1757]
MFLERIRTDGLAHFSWMIGAGGECAVIDPQRDIERYLEMARDKGARITHIFETHRNEDFVTGAAALAEATGAPVWHGPNADGPVHHARTIKDGESREVGSLVLRVLETPGHTEDSISIAVTDCDYADGAVAVFTGDALFVGDVGRTDFYPDRAREVAGKLWDSLQRILALGDQVILCPAHGAGSTCGGDMADREFSTLGHERRNNPRLQCDRDAFIEAKLAEHHYQPPYFRLMEDLNLDPPGRCAHPAAPTIMPWPKLRDCEPDIILDLRSVNAFQGGHLTGCQSLPLPMIASFAGWMLEQDTRIGLVAGSGQEAEQAARQLCRLGFEHVVGAATEVVGPVASGAEFSTLPAVDTECVRRRLNEPGGWMLLDVRAIDEFESGHIEGARHCYVGEVLKSPGSVGVDGPVTVLCASGARATLAASALQRAGLDEVDVYLGSTGAWQAAGHDLVS